MSAAPVFIGTLCRDAHFRRCVESLRACALSVDTHLFIGLDHPAKDDHVPGHESICAYLDQLNGFKDLTVIRRERNFGAIRNFWDGQNQVFSLYDRAIFSEDDNSFSPNFLIYMNKGLEQFESEKRVFGICGHNYPLAIPETYQGNFYAWQGSSVWGFALWKDRYQAISYNQNDFRRYLWNLRKVVQAYRIAPHYISSMINKTGSNQEFDPFSDAVINLHLREKGQYCIFPTITKVRNHGHDGSGLRSGTIAGTSPFSDQAIDDQSQFEFSCNEKEVFGNALIDRTLFRYFYKGHKQSVKTFVALLRFYAGRIN